MSLHLIDRHSQEAWRRMSQRPAIWLTPLNKAEVAHAVFLHVFWIKATQLEANRALSVFEQNAANGIWQNVSLPQGAFERSIELARKHGPALGVRTLDSLHVACALELKADRFWTFDERQARLAETVGLDTDRNSAEFAGFPRRSEAVKRPGPSASHSAASTTCQICRGTWQSGGQRRSPPWA